MKIEKIEELFNKHCSLEDKEVRPEKVLYYWDFTTAIKQAELEGHKKLDKKLDSLTDYENLGELLDAINDYQAEIQNKIKELENEY